MEIKTPWICLLLKQETTTKFITVYGYVKSEKCMK
jgi:hypothetical protein